MPYAILLASLFVFGFFPRLLTEQITPDAQKIVSMAAPAHSADKTVVQTDFSKIKNR